MTLFDTHIIVDWSALSKPSPQKPSKNSIWWAAARDGFVCKPEYVRTRHGATEQLATFIACELAKNRRVLAGFDFPFGFPIGVARKLTGEDSALKLWDWLEQHIEDSERNANNRFDVAEKVNKLYPGCGPFWGRLGNCPHSYVPARKSDRSNHDAHPQERRIADRRAEGAKTIWQLAYAGSVGSQTLLGLPALKRLIGKAHIKGRTSIWPFETGLSIPETDKQLVLAEVYPSLLKREISRCKREGEITDEAQVRVNADAFASLDNAGGLAPLFQGAPDLTPGERSIIETEEGWILGLGYDDTLRIALEWRTGPNVQIGGTSGNT